jgi:hypothetical protein
MIVKVPLCSPIGTLSPEAISLKPRSQAKEVIFTAIRGSPQGKRGSDVLDRNPMCFFGFNAIQYGQTGFCGAINPGLPSSTCVISQAKMLSCFPLFAVSQGPMN